MMKRKELQERIRGAKTDVERCNIALDALDTALCNLLNGYGDPYKPTKWWRAEVQKGMAAVSHAYNLCHEVGAMSWDVTMYEHLLHRRALATAETERLRFEERAAQAAALPPRQ